MRQHTKLLKLIESVVRPQPIVENQSDLDAHVEHMMKQFDDHSTGYSGYHEFKHPASHEEVVESMRKHAMSTGQQNSLADTEALHETYPHMYKDGRKHSAFTGEAEVPGTFDIESDPDGTHRISARENTE
jgi:hypothetical protein